MTYRELFYKATRLINHSQITEVGNKPIWGIRTNGGRRKNGDKCFDFFIHFGYLIFNYTNFNLQGRK